MAQNEPVFIDNMQVFETRHLPSDMERRISQLEIALRETQELAASLLDIAVYNGLAFPPMDDNLDVD